jgi:hypothetical protein
MMTLGAVLDHKLNAQEPKKVYWLSPVTNCDICSKPLTNEMCDIKTKLGPWGLLCMPCVGKHTTGKLGTGFGQRYEKQDDGRYLRGEG